MNNWVIAEEAAHKVIQKVQPASVSDEARREVVDYIQRLVKDKLGIEVYAYGSMPLRTYLPEGDIDFTAFCDKPREVLLADELKYLLEENKNTSSGLRVKDVQLIKAKVPIVKCIVQDIAVDISFNKIDGFYNLCFLEQMDRHIGKCHLFKRSIILIKAWCYYESRILGAKHSLVATHGLAILVLHIFYLYHSKIDGPLAALYTFLDYYSKFDWGTYCVSVCGPVRLSSLPNIVVDVPEGTGRNLLLNEDFLSSCIKKFSVPSNDHDLELNHLNIIDPLKTSNNLGNTVNEGNYYRIKSALTYGIENLGKILSLPENRIASELHNFFKDTMRHLKYGDSDYDTNSSSSLRDSKPKRLNLLTDLTGDLDRFIQCLEYGYGQLYKDQCISENSIPGESEDEYNARATRYLKDILKLSSPSNDLPESRNFVQSLDSGRICDDSELWLSQRTFGPCAFHYISEQQSILWSPFWLS